jgi:hypothetical protein
VNLLAGGWRGPKPPSVIPLPAATRPRRFRRSAP